MNQLIYSLLPALVGACLPLMAIANSKLGKVVGSPFTATWGVFVVALAGITLVILASKAPVPALHQLSNTKWWNWIGGLIVVMNIVTFTISPEKIGVGNMIIVFIASQLISSVVIEHYGFFSMPQHTVNWQRVSGVVLLIAGVWIIKKY